MAWASIPEPGTEYGPCKPTKGGNGVVLNCGHDDCRASREQAASLCRHCGREIGYESPFYADDEDRERQRLVHVPCEVRRQQMTSAMGRW